VRRHACAGCPQAPRTRSDVVQRITRSLAEAYEAVYAALDDPLSGYLAQGGSSAVKHTPSQVRTILGVI
jgi:conserved oligomeric Golgi complex subunit 6